MTLYKHQCNYVIIQLQFGVEFPELKYNASQVNLPKIATQKSEDGSSHESTGTLTYLARFCRSGVRLLIEFVEAGVGRCDEHG